MITREDFNSFLDMISSLTEVENHCILRVLGKATLNGAILIKDLLYLFKELGIKEKTQPKDRKHLKYKSLDTKSIRILNRLNIFLEDKHVTATEFLDHITFEQEVLIVDKKKKASRTFNSNR
jgi:hypothetical protein